MMEKQNKDCTINCKIINITKWESAICDFQKAAIICQKYKNVIELHSNDAL